MRKPERRSLGKNRSTSEKGFIMSSKSKKQKGSRKPTGQAKAAPATAIPGRFVILQTDGNVVTVPTCTMQLLELKQALEQTLAKAIGEINARAAAIAAQANTVAVVPSAPAPAPTPPATRTPPARVGAPGDIKDGVAEKPAEPAAEAAVEAAVEEAVEEK